MIRYDGMKAEEMKGNGSGKQLPAGPYVAMVIGAKIEGLAPDQSLVLALDVTEGEYKGFFNEKYKAAKENGSKYGEVKFKGTYRLRIPNPDNKNAQYPESDIARMNDMIYRFEKSNPNFHWDCDEQKLVGLTVGINMQEDSYNGNTFTRIGRLEIADDVRKGLVKAMNPRKRREQPQANNSMTVPTASQGDVFGGFMAVETDELPF